MTLVELMVVTSIIVLLMAMLFPAINVARESARQAACKNNLRQIGLGLQQHAERFDAFCTGAFDWRRDGSVTDYGWVADLVNVEIPVGKLLCPSNPYKISQTYNDLFAATVTGNGGMTSPSGLPADSCRNSFRLGSAPALQPDGSQLYNPCYAIANATYGSEANRTSLVTDQIYNKSFNTNYTASWWLVRTGALIDSSSGTLTNSTSCTTVTLDTLAVTLGPLTRSRADSATCPASFLPFMGCGAPATGSGAGLVQALGSTPTGTPTVVPFTGGPLDKTILSPTNPGTPVPTGPGYWTATDSAGQPNILQDYRQFAPVHRNSCNILFADGSVQSFADANKDGVLNNGFPAVAGIFADTTVELTPDSVFSLYSLRASTAPGVSIKSQ
jgi:prepilin-type processing-associated H-X9-DG protein